MKGTRRSYYHVDKTSMFKSTKKFKSGHKENEKLPKLETRRISTSVFHHYTRIMEMFKTDVHAIEEILGQDLRNPQGKGIMKDESYVDISTDSNSLFSSATGHSNLINSLEKVKQSLESMNRKKQRLEWEEQGLEWEEQGLEWEEESLVWEKQSLKWEKQNPESKTQRLKSELKSEKQRLESRKQRLESEKKRLKSVKQRLESEKQRLELKLAIEKPSLISARKESPFDNERFARIYDDTDIEIVKQMNNLTDKKPIKIVLIGAVGCGKSSFINTVTSSLKRRYVSHSATTPKAEGRVKHQDGHANDVSQVKPDEEPKVFCVSDEEMETYTTYELSEYQKKGVYIVRKDDKSIRAVINHILEKPIGKQLDHLYAQVEYLKNKKIDDYIARMESRRETRSVYSFLCTMRQDVDETIHSKAERFRICDPEKYSELAKPFNLLHDRIVSLQNELMKAPGSTEPMSSVGIERRQVSESVKTLLMGSTEVAAFGYIHDILEVWLKHSATGDQSNSKDSLKRQLRELLGEGEPYIFRNVKFTPAVNPGDKIYPTKDDRHFGTIGTFASSEDDLVGITIAHVTNGRNETFVDGDNELEKLGDVELSDSTGEGNSPVERIAFVQIGASMKQRVNMQLNKDGRKLTSRLYTGNASLVGQRVLKKGASTQWTNGIITFDEQCPNGQGIIVGDLSAKFCEKGDSGSAIIRYSPDNPDDNEVEVISILSGAWESRETESVGTHSLQLRTPLERLGDTRCTTYQLR